MQTAYKKCKTTIDKLSNEEWNNLKTYFELNFENKEQEVQELKNKLEFAKTFVPELDYLFQKKKEMMNNA